MKVEGSKKIPSPFYINPSRSMTSIHLNIVTSSIVTVDQIFTKPKGDSERRGYYNQGAHGGYFASY